MRDSGDFLADVRAAVNDDAPRLVYADWLEEHGQTSRAELIRVQCEMNHLSWYSKRHAALANRELQLLREHKEEWLGDFSTMVRSARFERGFVESIAIGAKQFSQHAESVFARAPITKVSLLQVSDKTAPDVASSAPLRLAQELLIHGSRMTNAGWQTLLTSEHLSGTTTLEISLDFESGRTTPSSVLSSLAKCPSLPGLGELRTWFLLLDDPAAQAAFQSLAMPSLRSLKLPTTRADALEIISAGPLLSQLVELDISGNHLNRNRWLERLGSTARELRTLRASNCGMSDREILGLCRESQIPGLEELDIRSNHITDHSLAAILTQLPGLKRLLSSYVRFDGNSLQTLQHAERIAPLEELTISNASGMTPSDGAILAARMQPTKLVLTFCELTDNVVAPLLESSNMRQLRWLDLSSNLLTDQTSRLILESPHLDGLRYLALRENDVSSDSKAALRSKYGTGVCTFSR